MKLILIKLFFALITFCLGISSVYLWRQETATSHQKITLCQLIQNPDLYRYQVVELEVEAVGGFGIFISDETCSTPARANIWISEEYQPAADIQFFRAESEMLHKARILVTGQFDPEATRGCWAPKAAIRATKIELKSEIKSEPLNKPEE